MEPCTGPGPNPPDVSVVQLICRAYGLSDASEITLDHIHRYIAERHRPDERTHPPGKRFRASIPRPRVSGDAA
ncbi:hypothetical protein ACFY12_19565 [Streptomyces sp. NPDC001339]|uniref:hypothetical protein n=1 Tax=Streptomyces sp. NPDC001339 TaxID=3364563 RepID=UPI0036BF6522